MAFGKAKATAQSPQPIGLLEQERNRLDVYNAQFDRAIHLFNEAIDSLGMTSQEISETMQEINEYEKELAATKAGLAAAKTKTEKVIANFKSMLSAD